MIANLSLFLAKHPITIFIVFGLCLLYFVIEIMAVNAIDKHQKQQGKKETKMILPFVIAPTIMAVITIAFLMLYGIFVDAPAPWFSRLSPAEAQFFHHKMENPGIPLTGNINDPQPLTILDFANLQVEYQKSIRKKPVAHPSYLQKQLQAMHYKGDDNND